VSSDDEFHEFIGAELLSVDIVDKALNKKTDIDVYEGGIIFVNIETSKGILQFAVYNEHNGYYGHSARVVVGDSELCNETL
jgi:hypothetical protein